MGKIQPLKRMASIFDSTIHLHICDRHVAELLPADRHFSVFRRFTVLMPNRRAEQLVGQSVRAAYGIDGESCLPP
jgi:hypothetical protein